MFLRSTKTVGLLVMICCAVVAAAAIGRSAHPKEGLAASSARSAEVVDGQLAVKLRPGATLGDLARIEAATGGRIERGYARSRVVRVRLSDGADEQAALAALRGDRAVAEANSEFVARLATAPDDPGYPAQWNLKNTANGVQAEAAWDAAPAKGQGVVVAILDTGVAYEACNCASGWYQPAPDLDGKTYVSPWDFVSNDARANDDNGHGTLVAGVLAQDTNNGWRNAGVAPNATIMPVKVINQGGSGNAADFVEGIYWAADHGADVINMSVVFQGTGLPDAQGNVCGEIVGLTAALDYAYASGAVLVAASGNDGTTANHVYCPAAYPAMLSVGATTSTGSVAAYSNRGAALDVTAPGGDNAAKITQEGYCLSWVQMYVSKIYDSFCPMSDTGTSLAAPHVAGIAALLLGEDSTLAPAEVSQILRTHARDRGAAGFDEAYGWGIVDAYASVLAVVGPPPTPTATSTPPPTATPIPSATVTPNPCSPDSDGDGMPDCYESTRPCLNVAVADAALDADGDALTNGAEHGFGTAPCAADTDGDGCGDGVELGPEARFGGQRNPLSAWDFYDVTGDRRIDARDISAVRTRYATHAGPELAYWDRSYGVAIWAPGPPNGAIDAVDLSLVRSAFGHVC